AARTRPSRRRGSFFALPRRAVQREFPPLIPLSRQAELTILVNPTRSLYFNWREISRLVRLFAPFDAGKNEKYGQGYSPVTVRNSNRIEKLALQPVRTVPT